MYILTDSGLGLTTNLLLSQALLLRAVRLNRCHRMWLGWDKYHEQIARHLMGNPRPAEGDFAVAVANWQQHKNSQSGKEPLQVDGIIGVETMKRLYSEMGLPLPSEIPLRPAEIFWEPSPNHVSRGNNQITTIVLHATSGNELRQAINTFKAGKTNDKKCRGTSAHYVIGRGGEIIQMVPLDRAACHAGDPYNRFSIGIELVNVGQKLNKKAPIKMCNKEVRKNGKWTCLEWKEETPSLALKDYYRYKKGDYLSEHEYWVPYTKKQYESLIKLIRFLVSCIPTINHITGHEHLACWRKRTIKGKVSYTKRRSDPGGAFDWKGLQQDLKGWFSGMICHKVGKYEKGTGRLVSNTCHIPVLPNLCR